MRIRSVLGSVAASLLLAVQPSAGSEPQPTTGTANAVQALAFDLPVHPNSEAVDLYKFLHQALFGPGHAVTDPAQAAQALQSEIADLGPPVVGETWCDTLGGEPILVRVNLRPFVANGFDAEDLVESFVATASSIQGDPKQMRVALDLVIRWLPTEERRDLADALKELAGKLERQGYPAVHHSAAYQQAYRPAYRVVEAAKASNYGWCGSVF